MATIPIGLPPMRDAGFDAKMRAQNTIYESEAATRPWIEFVSTTELFAGPDGGFAALLPDAPHAEPATPVVQAETTSRSAITRRVRRDISVRLSARRR